MPTASPFSVRARYSVADSVLVAMRHPSTDKDLAEDAEIESELADAIDENFALGDVTWRLDEWRRAERNRSATSTNPRLLDRLRDLADDACDAYHVAECEQRRRHGYSG